jgi:hypothetical protein
MFVSVLWIFSAIAVLLAIAIFIGSRIRKIFPEEPAPPAWAGFFSRQDYEHFLNRLRDVLQKTGVHSTVGNGIVSVLNGGSARHFPLAALADACREKTPNDWDTVLAEQLAQVTADLDAFDLADFDRIKDSLRLQLGISPGIAVEQTICRENLPGVETVLVLDLPMAVRTINPNEAAGWNVSSDELFQIALDHIRGMPTPKIEEIELDDRLTALVMTGESPFVASQVLLLEEYPKLLGPFGAIIAVPTWHILLSHPIHSRATQDALFPMAWIATRRWNDGPGSVTPRLYWYRNGRFTHLPYEFNGERFRLHPPKQFADMLASIRGNY